MPVRSVSVPPAIEAMFEKAEQLTRAYFRERTELPERGTIEISGERYILVRAASMSIEFVDLLMSMYHELDAAEARKVAADFLFDLAHALGEADARHFHQRFSITDPIEKLSLGPTHFAYTGWAFVSIDPESRPVPNENFFLVYEHPYSFEADAWLRQGRRSQAPVCTMNAGYSSGWCQESFGIPLIAAEMQCRAQGSERCRFLMAPPWRMGEHLARHHPGGAAPGERGEVAVPEFFQRKRLEDKLRRNLKHIEMLKAEGARKDEEIQRLREELAAAKG